MVIKRSDIMHYNWKKYSKFQCPMCFHAVARKNLEISKDDGVICSRCNVKMIDITPPKEYLIMTEDDMKRVGKIWRGEQMDEEMVYCKWVDTNVTMKQIPTSDQIALGMNPADLLRNIKD
jgi:hypothetical protein